MESLREPSAPTSFLPPLRQLSTCSSGALSLVLHSLIQLYQPDLRLHSQFQQVSGDSGYASDNDDDEPKVNSIHTDQMGNEFEELWQIARADPIEKDFAMRWMTGFLSRGLEWVAEAEGCESEMETEEREALYEGICTLLSSCSKASEAGALLRDFIFPSSRTGQEVGPDSGYTVKVVLKDEDLASSDHNGVGLQTWGASSVMAERIVPSPHQYGLSSSSFPCTSSSRPLRILELGAGTGLLSLVIGNLLVQMGDVWAEIYATDYHPDVLSNLDENLVANPESTSTCSSSSKPKVSIHAACLDWETVHTSPEAPLSAPFDEPFDIIIAADVVYQPQHASWLASVVRKLLRQPTADELDGNQMPPTAHIIAASRDTRSSTYPSLQASFPSVDKENDGIVGDIRAVQVMERSKLKGTGRSDENGYVEYMIRWC